MWSIVSLQNSDEVPVGYISGAVFQLVMSQLNPQVGYKGLVIWLVLLFVEYASSRVWWVGF